MTRPFIIGFGGTTRAGSSSEKLVRAVLTACENEGAQTRLFDGAFLARLPHYAPEKPERTVEQREFVEAVRQCNGLVIGTPAYHGGISGLVKNALDLLEDLRGDPRVYFDDCPVGLVVSAAGWQGTGITLSALRDMVHAMRGWPTPIGISVNTLAGPLFDASGAITEPQLDATIAGQASQIMRFTSAFRGPQVLKGAA
ncbi:NADPH-dependent FMN reductase [Paracoccus aestuariivivens]|uniref:NADPH-dependent FMN reductase n=1 Tax=Paracoccus aestuariivivens TaxID=1820333 RepID=A0A6L6JFE9_9RHOB|nr:NAD(P)H-dependent oxidoreductase [Paracoccus aestuariivivens]MTH79985.1 NADPH-dependent FMN reductase [Paracoccus aestuariivivens]